MLITGLFISRFYELYLTVIASPVQVKRTQGAHNDRCALPQVPDTLRALNDGNSLSL